MTREKWLSTFNPKERELWICEQKGDVVVYVTRDATHNPFPPAPIYHVWDGDEWAYCGKIYREAAETYQERVRRHRAS